MKRALLLTILFAAAPIVTRAYAADLLLRLGPEELVQAGGADISVLGYSVPSLADWDNDGLNDLIVGEGDRDIRIGFQNVPEDKVLKNRVHVDLSAPDEEAEARRIEALGATRLWVSEDPDDPFVVLADPEGNEFCVVRRPES